MPYKMHQTEDGNSKIRYIRTNTRSREQATHIEELGADWEGEYEIDPVIDKRITRKFDLYIIPWLFSIWSVLQDRFTVRFIDLVHQASCLNR
jgi:hypothetical protein